MDRDRYEFHEQTMSRSVWEEMRGQLSVTRKGGSTGEENKFMNAVPTPIVCESRCEPRGLAGVVARGQRISMAFAGRNADRDTPRGWKVLFPIEC